jgi:hypothetical protein
MQLRGDAQINSFLLSKVKSRSFATAFPIAEKFVATFHNDLPMYLLQNYLKGVDINNIKEYKGLSVKQALPVKNVQLRQGAFVKDGVMYLDFNQIESDFNTKAFAGQGYKSQGLATVDAETFNMGGNYQNLQEYIHFVMEREHLRSITPVGNESREVYEQKLATRALELSFNFYHMLKAPGVSIADQFLAIKAKYPQLAEQYMIFDQLGYVNEGAKADSEGNVVQSNNKKLKTLKLTSSRTDKDLANVLHENLVRLADPMTVKVENPVQNAEISRFFNRMIVAEYIRAGATKSSNNLASILPKDTLLKLMAEPLKEITEMKDKSKLLNDYFKRFTDIWNTSNSSTRQRFRNYLYTPDVSSVSTSSTDGTQLTKNIQGLFVYPSIAGAGSAKALLEKNSSIMLVYPNFKDSKDVFGVMQKANNSISFPITQDGKKVLSDETFEENAKMINDAITAIETQYENGNEVAFPEQGLTVVNGKDMLAAAPRTKNYMVLELYKRLNYVMPGSETDAALRKQMQSNQDITDEMVDEFMKKCFGE